MISIISFRENRLTAVINCTIVILILASVAYICHLIAKYDDLIYDPANVRYHIKVTLRDGLSFTWDTFIKPFAALDPALIHMTESRPRYLDYFLLFVDQKIQLNLYSWLPPHPSASIYWPLTLIGTPYLLWRYVNRSGAPAYAAWVTLVLYISSVGYLSNVSFNYTPGRPLESFLFVLLLNIIGGVRIGQLLWEIELKRSIPVLLIMLSGLVLGEEAVVIYLIVPLLMPGLFFAQISDRGIQRMALNGIYYALPGIVFLFFALVIYPAATRYFEGYEFNLLATLLPNVFHYADGSVPTSANGVPLTLTLIGRNFASLVGTSIAPWQITPWIPAGGGILYEQINNIAKLTVMAALIVGIICTIRRGSDNASFLLLRFVLAFCAFLVWHTYLQTYHIGVTNGYFYGSMHAVFFSIILAQVMTANLDLHRFAPIFVSMLLGAIVVTQVDNFHVINKSFARLLVSEPALKAEYPEIPLTVLPGASFTFGEARDLWRCWRGLDGACDVYRRPVSPRAAYLLGEFRAIDRARGVP